MSKDNLIKLSSYKKEIKKKEADDERDTYEKAEILRWAKEQRNLQLWRFAGVCVLFVSAAAVSVSLAILFSKLF